MAEATCGGDGANQIDHPDHLILGRLMQPLMHGEVLCMCQQSELAVRRNITGEVHAEKISVCRLRNMFPHGKELAQKAGSNTL